MTSFLVFAALVIGLLVALIGFAPEAMDQEHNRMSLVYYLCWLVLAGGAIVASFRDNWGKAARDAVIWLVILLALVAGYSIRHDLEDVGRSTLAALIPGSAWRQADGSIALRRADDGHFYVRAQVGAGAGGATIRLVVDTGASMVALAAEDAAKLGIDPQRLDFVMPVNTANGSTLVAPIRLERLAIGEVELFDVEAAVMRPGLLDTSLLGMSFLGRLRAYSFEGDTLSLRP